MNMHFLHPNGAKEPFKVILSFFPVVFIQSDLQSIYNRLCLSLEHQAHADGDSAVILGSLALSLNTFLSLAFSVQH